MWPRWATTSEDDAHAASPRPRSSDSKNHLQKQTYHRRCSSLYLGSHIRQCHRRIVRIKSRSEKYRLLWTLQIFLNSSDLINVRTERERLLHHSSQLALLHEISHSERRSWISAAEHGAKLRTVTLINDKRGWKTVKRDFRRRSLQPAAGEKASGYFK